MATLAPEERNDLLTAGAPRRLAPFLLRYRRLALIILLILRGNWAIGDGGGIALTAGISGLYSFSGFLPALAVAAIPIPLLLLITRRLI